MFSPTAIIAKIAITTIVSIVGNAWVRIIDIALLYVLLALGLIESLGAGYIGDFTGGILGSHYQDIFAFIVLILVLTLRPQGLLGERVADRA